jgi:large repetitive protein
VLVGTKVGESIVGGEGNDQLYGKSGDDTLVGDTGGKVTVALDIAVSLVDVDNSETLSLVVSDVPKGASLSAGRQNADGTWSLSIDDLKGLTITADDSTNFKLHVVATATDVSGAVMTQVGDINVILDNGNQDFLVGGRGNDNLSGGAGNDVMYGGSAPTGAPPKVATFADNDVVHGNDGNDVVYGNSGDDKVYGDAGNDLVSGGRGNDLVSGGTGNDVVKGNSGDDVITGDAGDDMISGGSGFDTLDYSMSLKGLVVDLAKHTASGMGNDMVQGIEKVVGSSFSDVMVGDGHDNVFEGGAGNDNLRGAKGNDVLTGGAGNDTFSWTKSDVFNVKAQTGWVDHVTDLQVGDKLDLTGFFRAGTANVESLVHVTDGKDGSTISVKFAGQFHDVVVLDGVHGVSAHDLMKDGMLFVA